MSEAETRPPRWPLLLGIVALLLTGALALLGGWLWVLGGPAGNEARDGGVSYPAASQDGYAVWERNDDGVPVRWDPCEPIELVLAPDGWPDGTRADLEAAIDTLQRASGLDLDVVGTTDERPSGSRLPYQPERYGDRWAPVLVAWAEPGEAGLPLRDIDRGVAVPVAVGADGDRTYVSGQVVFNLERDDLEPGDADRQSSWQATILHELAHLLGLAHVDDPEQLMYTYPGEGPVTLGDGDRRGLEAVGEGHDCRPAPAADAVEVAPAP